MFIILTITLVHYNANAQIKHFIYNPGIVITAPQGSSNVEDIFISGNPWGDFQIKANHFVSTNPRISISCLFKNIAIAGTGDTSSVENFSPFPFHYGDSIKLQTTISMSFWNNWDYGWDHGLPIDICSEQSDNQWWGGQQHTFLGFKFKKNNQDHYGWLEIEISTDYKTVTLKGWGYEDTPNKYILAGDTIGSPTGVIENEKITGKLYCFNSTVNYSHNDMREYDYEICIHNVDGSLINKFKSNKNSFSVDISNYSKGIYFIRVISNEFILSEKIFIN